MAKEYNDRLATFRLTSRPDGSEPPRQSVITDHSIQTRSKGARRNVFVDGEFAFGLSEETFVKMGLYKGTVLTEELMDQVREMEEIYQAKQMALRLVNRRLRSTHEIEQRLKERKIGSVAIQKTLLFLNEYNMLNDAQFAAAFVHDRLLKKPVGRYKLKMDLIGKGIKKNDAEDVVNNTVSNDHEMDNAMRAAESRAARLRSDDRQKCERSLQSFLQGRGFSWDVIRPVIRKVMDGYADNRSADNAD